MALPPLDPADVANLEEYRKQLAELSEKVITRALPRLKALGGAYGKYNRDLAEHTEAIIFAQNKLGNVNIAETSQKILEQTMTYIDRSALRSRLLMKESMNNKSDFEKQIQFIDRAMDDAKTEDEKKRLEAQRKHLVATASVEDMSRSKMRAAQQEFLNAKTDMDREMAQVSGAAIIRADKIMLADNLKLRKAQAGKEKSLQIEIAKTTDLVLKQKLTDDLARIKKGSDALLKREKDLESAIKSNIKLQEETLGTYKAGVRGFAGELMSKTFTGGLIGAIFKGQGFADLIPNMGMMVLERSGILDKMGGGMAGFLLGKDSEQAQKAGAGGAKTAQIVATESAKAMKELAEAGLEAGSIYTHDIHSEKILMDIYEFLTGNKAESAGATKPKDAAPKGGKIGKIKGTLSGIGAFLQSIAQGIASFGDRGVFKGALGLAAVGAAVIPFAFGMSFLAELPVAGLLAGTLAIVAVGTAAIFFGKFSSDILMGALVLGVLGIALLPMAFAFSILGGIDSGSLFLSILAIAAITTLALGIGALAMGTGGIGAAAILAGAALLAVLGISLIPVALALMMLGSVDGSKLIDLGIGLIALVPGLMLMALIAPLLPLVGIGLGLVGLGMIPFGLGMMLISMVDPSNLFALSLGLLALLPTIVLFGLLSPFIALGAYALGLLGLAMIPLGIAIGMLNPDSVASLNSLFSTLASVAPFLLLAALGITAIGMSLIFFGAAVGIATAVLAATAIASAIGAFFGLGKVSVLDQIFGLASISGKLMETANALNMIATAMQTLASALSTMGDSTSALETLDTIISLDATQMQTLHDVSMAMDKISSANKQLTGENQAGQLGAAAGSGAGMAIVSNNSSSSNSTAIIGSPTGRSTDPSILFSSERYYSMIYR